MLLHEVLDGIKTLKAPTASTGTGMTDEELMAKVDESLAHQEEISSQVKPAGNSESENDQGPPKPPKPPTPPKFIPPN